MPKYIVTIGSEIRTSRQFIDAQHNDIDSINNTASKGLLLVEEEDDKEVSQNWMLKI
jgi:hypothetical protein